MTDKIDEAAAAVAAEQPAQMITLAVTIASTNRQAALIVPLDLTPAEHLELAAWAVQIVPLELERVRGTARSRLIVPRRVT